MNKNKNGCNMRAFTLGISKKDFVSELKIHQAADNFLKGTYWENGKGCAVGCSLKSVSKLKDIDLNGFNSHVDYETHLGIPEWLARLEDTIFENVSDDRSKLWPVQFGEAINEGSDLDKVKTPFLIYILESCLDSMSSLKYDETEFPYVKKAVDGSVKAVTEMIRCHRDGADLSAAWSAAESAASAAWSAAWSAAESAAASAAESAASAAWSAAESAAWSAAFEKYADKLLKLIKKEKS